MRDYVELCNKMETIFLPFIEDHNENDINDAIADIIDVVRDELKAVDFIKEELEKYKTLCYKTESNYINQLSRLKQTYETALINEREQHQRELEDKWEDIHHKANMVAMKKYQGTKYEKLKLDVEFSVDMHDLEAIKFH